MGRISENWKHSNISPFDDVLEANKKLSHNHSKYRYPLNENSWARRNLLFHSIDFDSIATDHKSNCHVYILPAAHGPKIYEKCSKKHSILKQFVTGRSPSSPINLSNVDRLWFLESSHATCVWMKKS